MTKHCVGNYEQNMYHDSYFYSLFWDTETKELTNEMVGATAFAGGAYRTALTDDKTVWKEVEAYKEKCLADARLRQRNLIAKRYREARTILKNNKVNTVFSKSVTLEDLEDIAALFDYRVRSKFKLSMREQVKNWAPGQYKTPLSPKQLSYVRRPMVDRYGRKTALAFKRAPAFSPLHKFRGLGAE